MRRRAHRAGSRDQRDPNISGNQRLGNLRSADVDELRAYAFLFEQPLLFDERNERIGAAQR